MAQYLWFWLVSVLKNLIISDGLALGFLILVNYYFNIFILLNSQNILSNMQFSDLPTVRK